MRNDLHKNIALAFKEHNLLTKENEVMKLGLLQLTQIINGKEYQNCPQKMELSKKLNEIITYINILVDEINAN